MNSGNSRASRPFLCLREGTFRLGDRLVFANSSWTFGADQHWAVTGPNGSGKSLFADGLRGALPLVHGELQYHYRAAAGLSQEQMIGHVAFEDRKRELHGTVVQSRWNSLEEEEALRVKDFLDYDRVMEVNPFEVSARDEPARHRFAQRRRQAIQLLDLQALLARALLSLSNGERQRAELARALCRPLRLLILDEPFAGLDAVMQARWRNILGRLMNTSLRVLLITTRTEDLPPQITHALCLEHCRVVAAGPKDEIIGRGATVGRGARGPLRRAPTRGRRQPAAAIGSRHWRIPARRELVRLNHVTVRYGKTVILQDVSWTIRPGESWALLGPNGSGKSTLLSLLLGDHPQVYANDIVVFGQRRGEGESVWELKQRIGWVSPELQLHFDEGLTCFEAVCSGFRDSIGLFEPLSRRQAAQVRRLLGRFGLAGRARTPLFELSAGTQRLALLARALVKEPPLLILDEPCQGLDARHRREFVSTVEHLLRAGSVTAVYVTHRDDEIPPSIRRVLRLSRGQALTSV